MSHRFIPEAVVRAETLARRHRAIHGLLVCAILAGPAFADEINDYVRAEMQSKHIPGISLAIVQDGNTTRTQSYGVASVELGVPVTPDSVFDIASLTKPFTATAVLMLVEEGRVRLDDPITKFLSNAPATWNHITIRHLLTHTGGFAGLQNTFFGDSNKLPDGGLWAEYSTAILFDAVRRRPLDFPPGERWQYSDEGYFLLGMIIESVSGKRYHEFLAQRIFRPLGMTSSCVIDQWAIVPNRVAGYMLRDGNLAPNRRIWQIELQSYGGILSTATDLAKWDTALHQGRLLEKATVEQMQTPGHLNDGTVLQYGLGWFVGDYRGKKVVEHSGSTGTDIFCLPEVKLTVILLTNLDAKSGSNPRRIAEGVARLLLARLSPTRPADGPDASAR